MIGHGILQLSATLPAVSHDSKAPRRSAPASLVFVDPASQAILNLLERVAPSEVPVMVTGETGTGKELIARHIHEVSARKGPFLAVNCGAIAPELAESELFGHEAGAFTGAKTRREGWFEAANGGTLFLDEIGDLPLPMQSKLLRVLQEREVVRIGSRKAMPVDVRLITATNIDLHAAVAASHFRLDLYYRLNVAHVRLPPLRERKGDIVALAQHFLSFYSERLKLPLPMLSEAAVATLNRYSWPGNIRELENVVHFALLVASDEIIRPENLKLSHDPSFGTELNGKREHGKAPLERVTDALLELMTDAEADLYEKLERCIVDTSFRQSGSNQVRAAALLGISRNVYRTLLKRHGFLDKGEEPAIADLEQLSVDAGRTD
jgi:DNA-binding NtrC family response regulator